MTITSSVSARSAFDVDDFPAGLRGNPLAVRAILHWIGGIECFRVEILHVRAVVRESPGDLIVVSDHNAGNAGQREALGIPSGNA